ncbi:mitochondrial inner membrane protein OXA1-like isoform X2 [Rhodamnia argentea]|uniref:Mitochondrial inner membrane protein OXA1-like isoform X2 n=1 Tax=Rhodamnia argentea TaxID=178133 RepID=A0ABM3H7W7_9MYRT|nr:mitochondrial inner membrane protein OXA1-like isoform X2 [Rhodamnia argentea]
MACRRSLSTTGTLIARRLRLSFFHIHRDNRDEAICCSPERVCSSQSTLINSLPRASSGSRNLLGPQSKARRGLLFMLPPGISSSLCRFMSNASGDEGSFKIDDFVREVTTEKVMDVVTPQSSVMSEVALAAADSSYPVAAIEYLIGAAHSFTGLNWWASIALTTVLIRGATVPLQINQMRSTAKLSLMRPHVEELNRTVRETANAPDAASKYLQRFTSLFKEYGVSPFTPLKGILIRGPIFISFLFAIRNMAEKIPSFQTGGNLWFVNLATPDSLYILPILTALTFWIAVEFHLEEGLEGTAVAGDVWLLAYLQSFLPRIWVSGKTARSQEIPESS